MTSFLLYNATVHGMCIRSAKMHCLLRCKRNVCSWSIVFPSSEDTFSPPGSFQFIMHRLIYGHEKLHDRESVPGGFRLKNLNKCNLREGALFSSICHQHDAHLQHNSEIIFFPQPNPGFAFLKGGRWWWCCYCFASSRLI